MSSKKHPEKKIIKAKASPAKARASAAVKKELLFGRRNFIFMGIGLGLIVLGCLLMLGGAMPDKETWDDSIIYSFRRITLAPILILAGLGVEIYAIFTRPE